MARLLDCRTGGDGLLLERFPGRRQGLHTGDCRSQGSQAGSARLLGRHAEEAREVALGAVEGAGGAGALRFGGGERGVGAKRFHLGSLSDGEKLSGAVELEGEGGDAGLLRSEDLAAGERRSEGGSDACGDRLFSGRERSTRGRLLRLRLMRALRLCAGVEQGIAEIQRSLDDGLGEGRKVGRNEGMNRTGDHRIVVLQRLGVELDDRAPARLHFAGGRGRFGDTRPGRSDRRVAIEGELDRGGKGQRGRVGRRPSDSAGGDDEQGDQKRARDRKVGAPRRRWGKRWASHPWSSGPRVVLSAEAARARTAAGVVKERT